MEDARISTAEPYYEGAFDRTPTIDVKRLEGELKANSQAIKKGAPKEVADVKAMVSEMQTTGIPTMQIIDSRYLPCR